MNMEPTICDFGNGWGIFVDLEKTELSTSTIKITQNYKRHTYSEYSPDIYEDEDNYVDEYCHANILDYYEDNDSEKEISKTPTQIGRIITTTFIVGVMSYICLFS